MNKRRIIFLSIFGGYHLVSFLFTLFMESRMNDLSVLYGLFGKIYLFKYVAFLGLGLFVVEAVWTWRDSKNLEKEKEAMRHENNVLKAKVYDLAETVKKSSTI
jgi:putative Ca2+/H+ antiporter (TMEM165/GDT1 family)